MAQVVLSAYDHITQNNRKTLLLVLLFPISLFLVVLLACWAVVYLINDPDMIIDGIALLPEKIAPDYPSTFFASLGYAYVLLIPTFVIAFFWLIISYFFGDKMMMAFAGAVPVKKEDAKRLYNAVENTAIMAGLPMPKLYIVEDASLNAFATGSHPKNASIAVTRGLIEKLSPMELQGVIAHEMAHIGNRDIRLNMLIIIGIGIFYSLGMRCLRSASNSSSSRNDDKKGNNFALLFLALGIAFLIFHFIIAPLIQKAVSRQREYAADATGAKILHNSKVLADALEKISQDSRVEVLDQQKNMATACIASPFAAVSKLTSTHPPIDERIRRLRAM